MVEAAAGYKHLRVLAAAKAILDAVKLLEGAGALSQPFLYALKENRPTVRARTVFGRGCTKHHTAHYTHFGASEDKRAFHTIYTLQDRGGAKELNVSCLS